MWRQACVVIALLPPQAVGHSVPRKLPLVEALVDAGYRPRTFTNLQVAAMRSYPLDLREPVEQPDAEFDPLRDDPGLRLAVCNMWVLIGWVGVWHACTTRPQVAPGGERLRVSTVAGVACTRQF